METAVRPAFFVPESIKADVLFRSMKKSRNYFAIVLDEYGGMSGIITMSDLVQQLVGEIDDEDLLERELKIELIDSQTWNILGNTPLDDVAKQLKVSLPTEEYDTFGGFIFGTLGTIPEDGSQFEIEVNGLTIKVIEVKDHRVEKAVVCLTKNDIK